MSSSTENFNNYFFIEALLFFASFISCLIPKGIKRFDKLSKIFPFLTLVSAGLLLAVLLLDFLPHMFLDHSHDKNHNHDHSHSKTQNYDVITAGMLSAGVALLCLIGIDQCIINHNHCEENDEHHEHSHTNNIETEDIGCCNTKMLKNTKSKTQALIYILSISIHSFFEGLAFQKNKNFSSFELGILAHKILESFAIGTTLFNSALSFKVCIFLNIFYSLLTPFGIWLAYNHSGEAYKIGDVPISMLFKGLALGSLIFVVFMEMIPGAFHKSGNKLAKMGGLTLGFVISSITIYKSHSD